MRRFCFYLLILFLQYAVGSCLSQKREEQNECSFGEIRDSVELFTGDFGFPFAHYQVWDGTTFVLEDLEEDPVFRNGGNGAFLASVYSHLQYPEEAKNLGLEGKLWVYLIIDQFGEMEAIGVENKIGQGCEVAALQATRQIALGGFLPGRSRGKTQKIKMVFPIEFSLQ